MTTVATALLETLARTPLNKREGQVYAAISLATVVSGRSEASLSSQQLAECTGIDARHVPAPLQRLDERGLIVRSGGNGVPATIALTLPAVVQETANAEAATKPPLGLVTAGVTATSATAASTPDDVAKDVCLRKFGPPPSETVQ